jgi:hypothetical protein
MSVVPESIEIMVETFKKEDQEAASLIAGPFNTFVLQMIQSINQSLTINENMLGETRTFKFNSTSLETTFKYNGKGMPKHMVISYVDKEPETAIMPYWSQDGKGNITVKILGTLTVDIDYNITFIILAG